MLFTLSAAECTARLFRLAVYGVFLAESAVLLHLETVRVVLLVLDGVVVSLFAFIATQRDLNAHNGTSLFASLHLRG